MNNVKLNDLSKCYSCSACYSICPKSAITMSLNGHGFYKPVIDENKCIDCGLCVKTCIIGRGTEFRQPASLCYGVKHRTESVVQNSTSGGAFALFAESIVADGGTIIACAMVDNRAVHIESQDYSVFHGSKYVQSDLQNAFSLVVANLESKRKVLFVGTPCQCAGLRSFLKIKKIDTSELFVVDFVCHGTPSPGIFGDYIRYIEKKYKVKVAEHKFRTKHNGWKAHLEENIYVSGKSDYESYDSQVYKGIFYSALAMNNSCYECEYTSVNRVSDITIADFWGVKESHPDFWNNEGVSFVMLNSDKGKALFDTVNSDCEYIPVNVEDTKQPHLYRPISRPDKTDQFWLEYTKKGFKYVIYKYCHAGPIRRAISNLYRLIMHR